MASLQSDPLLQVETTCGTLLYELQIIWNEVGESDAERDKMLLELEQECLEVYRRKVDQANRSRAQLRQAIADSEAELATICSAMGERPVHLRQPDQNVGSLKEELSSIIPQLEEMRKWKEDRVNQFLDVLMQIQKISDEISQPSQCNLSKIVLDESDLSIRKLEEFHRQLQALQKEKTDRLKQIMDQLNSLSSLCSVLGMDFKRTVSEIHPSLEESELPRSISNNTIERLGAAIQRLKEVKIQRMQKLQDLATTMLELWHLMDTPVEEQQMFQNVTCNIAASEHEINEPNTLSVDFINYVEAEVSRLEELKGSKMKELVLKKRTELEEICRRTHMVAEIDDSMEYAIAAIESGAVDPSSILEQIEFQIAKVKEEAFSRKEILERVEKWLAACEEENWLEDYNRDENRYNAGRGTHLTLKRAEKARAAVSKLPAMVEALASKTTAWERERGTEFTYDGVRLLSMLEEYSILRQEKEHERRRQRDQKRLQGQLIAEQEALYGSKPSPSKPQSARKIPRTSTGSANRRLSLGGAMLHPQSLDLPHFTKTTHGATVKTASSRATRKTDRLTHNEPQIHQQDDSVAALSAGRRGLDVAGLPAKKHPFNATNVKENEAAVLRKPFSPVSALSSKANATNFSDDPQKLPNPTSLKIVLSKTPLATPSKGTSINDEENKTPKAVPISVPTTPSVSVLVHTSTTSTQIAATPKAMPPVIVPTTPSSVSIPMQTSTTPQITATAVLFSNAGTPVQEKLEEIEYSFEERRLGFVLLKSQVC